jgi:hypothetical protein
MTQQRHFSEHDCRCYPMPAPALRRLSARSTLLPEVLRKPQAALDIEVEARRTIKPARHVSYGSTTSPQSAFCFQSRRVKLL